MVEDEFEELSMDDDNLEREEEVKPVKKGRPVAPTKAMPVQQAQKSSKRYVAVHQVAMEGIVDTLDNNKPVAIDIWDMLANIYNKLEAIERAVGV